MDFTDRIVAEQSLPTVCPNCHRQQPTTPMFPRYVDQEATEPRLVSWAKESEKMVHHDWTVRQLQLEPSALDRIVDDYGVGLTRRIASTHEFKGSEVARTNGVQIIRRRWPDIQPVVREAAATFFKEQLITAVGLAPKDASLLVNPKTLAAVLSSVHGGTVQLGRWGATATAGQRVGNFVIYGAEPYAVYLTLVDRPIWLYEISPAAFIKTHDPFVAEVARQVYDNTKWIKHLMPLLLKVGAFGLGFSGSIALVITGIVLDELATEMQADAEGRPGRTPLEILGSAGTQLLVDRLFHGLFGGGAGGKVVAGAGEAALKAERIAERAAPLVRKELAQAEKPLVKDALEAGAARQIKDKALLAEGYSVEVAIESAGERHLFRLKKDGHWCRFSTTICDLDLGSEVVAATKSPKSFTQAKLEDTRALRATAESEMKFLGSTYERMRAAGKVDVALLSAEERKLLDELAPTGDASKLSLRELRDLPQTLGLKKDISVAADLEVKLIEQLYREGRPLYEIMRAASPSYAARAKVLAEAGGRDAASGLPKRVALEVDHVVPLNEIVRMPGFDKLRPERQLQVVNNVDNLRAIEAAANSSRGDRSWSSWAQAAIFYDAAAVARMRALEDKMRSELAAQILALSRP